MTSETGNFCRRSLCEKPLACQRSARATAGFFGRTDRRDEESLKRLDALAEKPDAAKVRWPKKRPRRPYVTDQFVRERKRTKTFSVAASRIACSI